jgi:hypothetical protein
MLPGRFDNDPDKRQSGSALLSLFDWSQNRIKGELLLIQVRVEVFRERPQREKLCLSLCRTLLSRPKLLLISPSRLHNGRNRSPLSYAL